MKENIAEKVKSYRKSLRQEMGIPSPADTRFIPPIKRPFVKSERSDVTILFGGLTVTHEALLKGVLEGLGYRADYIPSPDNAALSLGREYCNRGQCNPTYYTVGNLIKHLEKLRSEGEEDIEDKYVFATVGSCGPCRLGMYEEEYKRALKAAGFERFRVIMINQHGDVAKNAEEEAGLTTGKEFYKSVIKSLMAADLINEMRCKIRPYEVTAGATELAAKEAIDLLYRTFKEKKSVFMALRKTRKIFGGVEADFTRLKPKVKIIGEFWAQTTEGDGNYKLLEWLEKEGCEAVIEPVSVMVHYTMWLWRQYLMDRIRADASLSRRYYLLMGYLKLSLVEKLFQFHYNLYRMSLGFVSKPLPSQNKLAKLAEGYFDPRITGGEGHLEIAKNLLAIQENKAHLVISVKPFGCMPSTQCDGVQVKVMSDHKEGLFIPIETSGDGEVNVKSRIQMKLHEAREKAKEEFSKVLSDAGLCTETVKNVSKGGGYTSSALVKFPSRAAVTAANYILCLAKKGRLSV